MTSEDVIHDFSVPAFRIKHDVLPGRYETLWFHGDAARHLSPVLHAALRHRPFRRWSARSWRWRRPTTRRGWSRTAAARRGRAGKPLFMRYGCSGCHGGNGVGGNQSTSTVRAPPLAGLYGSPVPLVGRHGRDRR